MKNGIHIQPRGAGWSGQRREWFILFDLNNFAVFNVFFHLYVRCMSVDVQGKGAYT